MFFLGRMIAASLAIGMMNAVAAPKASKPNASPATKATASQTPKLMAAEPKLTAEQMANATKVDGVTIPTAGEFLAAINKLGKPNWQASYRAPIPTAFSSRPQIALNLGGLIADGFLAVEAEDAQQVKNTGKDIVSLAKSLGVSQNVLSRGSSITDFAERNEWSVLKEELEATQNEVKLAMDDQHDEELVVLVSMGGWMRGLEIFSGWVVNNYDPANAKLLRQPALVAYMRNKMAALPEKVQGDSMVKVLSKRLEDVQKLVSFPRDKVPPIEDVKALKELASDLVKQIASKPQK